MQWLLEYFDAFIIQFGRVVGSNMMDEQQKLLRIVMLQLWGNGWHPEEELLVIRFLQVCHNIHQDTKLSHHLFVYVFVRSEKNVFFCLFD